MKEYLINTDSGISFGVYGVSEDEARETAEDILNSTIITSVVETVRPLQYNRGKKERSMEMPYVYNVRTNLSLVDFEVIADDENEALHTAEVILDQLVVRDVQQGREVV